MSETDHASSADDAPITPAKFAELVLAQRKAFETAVTLRAWNDPVFAEQLALEPIAAINAAFDLDLPADITVNIHHETSTSLHLSLPPMPAIAIDSNELTDDDLERVSGGGLALGASIISAGAGISLTVSGVSVVSTALSATTVVGTVRATQNL